MNAILEIMPIWASLTGVIWLITIIGHGVFFLIYRLIWKGISYFRFLMCKQDNDLEKTQLYLKEMLEILRRKNNS